MWLATNVTEVKKSGSSYLLLFLVDCSPSISKLLIPGLPTSLGDRVQISHAKFACEFNRTRISPRLNFGPNYGLKVQKSQAKFASESVWFPPNFRRILGDFGPKQVSSCCPKFASTMEVFLVENIYFFLGNNALELIEFACEFDIQTGDFPGEN